MQKHPSDTELVRATLAEAHEPVGRATRAHLDAGCDRCRRRLEELAAVIAALRAPALERAPDETVARAAAWLAEQTAGAAAVEAGEGAAAAAGGRTSSAARAGGRIRRALEELRAALVLDSAQGALLAGIRGPATVSGRWLLFESPAGNVHVQIEPTATGRVTILGQWLPAAAGAALASGRAWVEQAGRSRACRLSNAGEFRFDLEAAGEIRLQIEWSGRRIRLDPLGPVDPV